MQKNNKSPKVFYGWWIVSASFLITLIVGGTVYRGFTAMFEPIADEFGWSYAQISLAASLRGLETGILSPVSGILVDRWGPRPLIFAGVIILAIGLYLLSLTTSLGMFYGSFVIIAMGVSLTSMTVLMAAVANWFEKKVGIASGLALAGFGLSGLMIPLIVWLIDIYEWRTTLNILSATMLITVIPLSLLFRHKPEQYGYALDGRVITEPGLGTDGVATEAMVEEKITVSEAIKTRIFWHLVLTFACRQTIVSAMTTHVMPYLSSVGINRSFSSLIATIVPVVSIVPRISFGWITDKMDGRRAGLASFALLSFGTLIFAYITDSNTWLFIPFLILFGAGYGGTSVLRPSIVRELFGRATFGAVFGVIAGISMLGTVIGSPIAGWTYDTWGSYRGIWIVFAGVALIALLSLFTIPQNKPKSNASEIS